MERYLARYPAYREPQRKDLRNLESRLQSVSVRIGLYPDLIEERLTRGELLLKLRYPELSVSDAKKALIFIDTNAAEARPDLDDEALDILRCRTILLIGRSLFLGRCFVDCLDIVPKNPSKNKYAKDEDFVRLRRYAQKALEFELDHNMQDPSFQEMSEEDQEHSISKGEIMVVPYPWISDKLFRRKASAIDHANSDIWKLSQGRVIIKQSTLSDQLREYGQIRPDQDSYGIFATKDIPADTELFWDRTILCATTGEDRCAACCADLNQNVFYTTALESCCDMACLRRLRMACQPGRRAEVQGMLADAPQNEDEALLHRGLIMAHKYTQDNPSKHPLRARLLNRLTARYHPGARRAFSYGAEVCRPIEILQKLGVDIFTDDLSEAWVLETMFNRISTNVRAVEPDGNAIVAVNTLYSFFNHSCDPNVDTLEDDLKGDSSVGMVTNRKIFKGEELYISYIADKDLRKGYHQRKKLLEYWTGGECLCRKCAYERGSSWTLDDDMEFEDESGAHNESQRRRGGHYSDFEADWVVHDTDDLSEDSYQEE